MAARPRPGRTNPETSKTLARPSTKSQKKATAAAERTTEATKAADAKEEDTPVFTPDGRALVKITFGASELIPTGDFANVCLGPAITTVWIDPLADEPLSQEMKDGIVKANNQLAETLLRDVLGVQRNIILEALQDEASSD